MATAASIAATPAAFADAKGDALAYNYAMRCFVAGGILISDLRRSGAAAQRIAAADTETRKSYDFAYRVGGKLGYSKKQISGDMDGFQRTEARRMLLETGYFNSVRDDCVKLDLMAERLSP